MRIDAQGSSASRHVRVSTLTAAELWCEYAVDPIGLDVAEPRFGWRLQARRRGELQSAYQILVAGSAEQLARGIGDKWDSARVMSDRSVNVPYEGAPLASGERLFWQVRVWDKDGREGAYSVSATFRMGLLRQDDWRGAWIEPEQNGAAPLLRKEFTLDKQIKEATVYLSGLGLYELSINGTRIGDHVLDPVLADYRRRVPYVAYDVAEHLRAGQNVVAVMLGNGWYQGILCPWTNNSHRYRFADSVKLLLQMNVDHTDGTKSMVVSDPSWKVGRGPIVHNSLQEGETYDARLEQPGWDRPGYDDSSWSAARPADPPPGALFSQLMPAMKVIETRAPVSLAVPRDGTYVYDFGQLFGGWIRIRLHGPRGAKVVIKHSSRILPDGTIDDEAYPGLREADTYILRGAPEGETYEPRFTFHPVHYVQVTGSPRELSKADVQGKVVHSAIDMRGEFSCSNGLLDRIHRNVTWTMRNALKGFPLDCLHREPLGYNEPASVSSLLYTRKHMPLFWSKWLEDIRATQREDGSLSDWAPELPESNRKHDAAQAGNYAPLVWYLYESYDDARILATHYAAMQRYVDFLSSIAEDGIITTGWLGDHLLPGAAPGQEVYTSDETPPPLIWTGYYYRSALVVAQAAAALGRSDDARRYGALAQRIESAFNDAYFDEHSDNYATGSQTANAFSLALGIVPEDHRDGVLRNLHRAIMETHRGHIHTGHIGTTSLIEVLTKYGDGEALFALATAPTYPGWGYMVHEGATTIWESWGKDRGRDGGRKVNLADSMMMWGCIDKFLYSFIAGIGEPAFHGPNRTVPAFGEIRIQPHVVGDLSFARASVMTVRGVVSSSWQVADGSLALAVAIPANCRATVAIPKRGLDHVTVQEQGVVVFERGSVSGEIAGILGGSESSECVELHLGSGSYSFTLSGVSSHPQARRAAGNERR